MVGTLVELVHDDVLPSSYLATSGASTSYSTTPTSRVARATLASSIGRKHKIHGMCCELVLGVLASRYTTLRLVEY